MPGEKSRRMSKEIYISCTPHETRLAIVENDGLAEIYYERENEYTLAGSIYNGRVTRVLPGMQSSFVDIGLERDAFLYITDFMEEAGDSAEFEGGGERAPREARGEGRTERTGADRSERSDRSDRGDRGGGDRSEARRDRGGRGDRTDRPERPRVAATEPSDEELFSSAVSGLDPARPVAPSRSETGRSERGGRRRGGRDRRFNSDGTPRRERTEAGPGVNGVEETRPVEELRVAPVEESSTEPLGEGAPGADGSRRWRGRRGRRGVRGPGQEMDATGAMAAEPVAEFVAEDEFAGPGVAKPVDATPERVDDRAESDGQGRGGRDGRRKRGEGGRRERGGAAVFPRVPRGFAPSLNLHQVDGSADEVLAEEPAPRPYGVEEEMAVPAEPVILPGESLGKYHKGADGAVETVAASTAPAAPAAEFRLAGAWDGGAVLPGETIRPRGGASGSAPESRPEREDRGRGDRGREDRGDGGRGDRGRGGRDRSGDRGPGSRDGEARPARENAPRVFYAEDAAVGAQEIEGAEPVEFIHAVAPPVEAAGNELVHAVELPAELAEVAAGPDEFPVAQELPEARAEATHAVAPIHSTFVAPPPMPVVDEPVLVEEETEYEPVEASASFRVDPVTPVEFRQAAAVEDEPAGEFVEETAGQDETTDVTTISETGDMHSEAPMEADVAAPSGAEAEPSGIFADGEHSEREEQYAGFSPGDGLLEEEEMVEEDGEVLPSVQAARYEEREADGYEQEALEVAADLGAMMRELSIDEITHTEPAQTEDEDDSEEDFEEDFLEEDQEDDAAELPGEDGAMPVEALDEVEDSAYGSGFEGRHEDEAAGGSEEASAEGSADAREPRRDGRREDRGRREGRRGGGDRGRRSAGSERSGADRPGAGSEHSGSDRGGSRDMRGGRGSRQSMQMTNLPAISDLLKPGQEILCQIAKEPIAKKGARITSHIALPGRFLVFMPTVHHTGVSRKIESDGERRRLKEILLSEKGEAAGGFIVRTAAAGASEEELRSDLRFLLNLWSDIKARSESSKSPALIYHDLNLIERVLRDQVTDNFSAIWVDSEVEYERVLRFLQRFQPSLIRRVKLYTKETPLFEQFGITEEINKALRSKVWLKSGGSIVINQTEALVAIDINTGKFVGKTARLEDTIVKTNLDAIPEIVRQIRLRDLGGIIIIDFIDMDERKNRNRVMAALEEELKLDRAPSKVLQFNDFGLVAITRKRVKQSLERTLSTTCGVCAGTGMTKSPVTVCNDIYVEMKKMQKHLDRGDVMLRVHPEVVKQLKAPSTHWLQELEEMMGKTILVKSDPSLHPEQFDIH